MKLKDSLIFLSKDSFFYGIAGSFVKLAPLFIYPVLNRLVTQDGIGSLDVAMATATYFIVMITLGLDSAVARFYYDTDKISERKKLLQLHSQFQF